MENWKHRIVLISLLFTASFKYSNANCGVVGTHPPLLVNIWILDTEEDIFWENDTTDVAGINTTEYSEVTSYREYVSANIIDSKFVLTPTALFKEYEKYETVAVTHLRVTFNCLRGTVSHPALPFQINVIDTNNNDPIFNLPPNADGYVFTIFTPVPPGFEITGCVNDITVTDIDLTTQRIDFEIEENPYFEIDYDEEASPKHKKFKAKLRTKMYIGSMPARIQFTIKATDVDLTGDPRRNTTTTLTILANADFELPEQPIFSQTFYLANYTNDNHVVLTKPITLQTGYDEHVQFNIEGEHVVNFELESDPDHENQLSIRVILPLEGDELLEHNIHLIVRAHREHTSGASATVVLRLPKVVPLEFETAHYKGTIENNYLDVPHLILSQGYEGETVTATVGNEHSSYFTADVHGNKVTLSMGSLDENIINENSFLNLVVSATTGRNTATTIVTLEIIKDDSVTPVFDETVYRGTYSNPGGLTHDHIVLVQGYDGIDEVALLGDYANNFVPKLNGATVTIEAREPFPPELYSRERIVLSLEVRKPRTVGASAAVIITLPVENTEGAELSFDQITYLGSIENNETHIGPITVTEAYADDVVFSLSGDLERYFIPNSDGSVLDVEIWLPIPAASIPANRIIMLTVRAVALRANTAYATIVFQVVMEDDTSPTVQLAFDAAYYTGTYNANDDLDMHTTIALLDGHDDTVEFKLHGEQSLWFGVELLPNSVRVVMTDAIPAAVLQNNNHLVFTISAKKTGAATAQATIIISLTDGPSVTFSSNSYVLTVGEAQTGFVGRVSATADNGEAVTYLLKTDDDPHLQTRLSINNEGELYLSAPANSGVYTIEVIATTVTSQATATAPVHLRVKAVTECADNSIVTHPLITLDRDEEAAHNNLVVLDPTQHAGCHFTLTNRWPTDQTWLYVDENGLHTIAIDREHPSIAFMALSQVQVELVLHCESDSAVRQKRSDRTERLGPYDYGGNNWILTDTITYDSRRSLVNLIVNDINDNNPIFVGKEHEPIAVGYPTDELEERILPRSLAELKATDADIGENAALRYWSSESVLAVAPTTGFVHVRSGARLTYDQLLTVTATDRAGQGLSGTIQLVVKLLDINHIAVLTIRDAFLDDETTVLAQLSDAVGYEVRTLRSVVISDDIDGDVTRNKRETTTTSASLQLYVYGINDREPVAVNRLVADISSNSAMAGVVITIPLEDHLENVSDNQIGLLVSTIVLGVLLFAVILLVAIWFFLRWRKNRNYNEFKDENSLSSRNASLGELPKPEVVQPRLNIEDLKKSERRLQEMLHAAPIEGVTAKPMSRNMDTPVEAILDLPIHEQSAPVVIQSIDKLKDADEASDDEFGEVGVKQRKSVVTFNENVEKIVHVEDNIDNGDGSVNFNQNVGALNTGYEFFRL